MHIGSVSVESLTEAITFFISITKAAHRTKGFGFLADLRASSPTILKIIIEALDKIEVGEYIISQVGIAENL